MQSVLCAAIIAHYKVSKVSELLN